ncbi:WYL domain-containing protein [Saccharopolyspora shandongensis]|uniref:helix-turn-helix transcriptional regulator n=1 Tax=Saccharopolyspora shandongensis TaxID=418495 RepID=UPI00341CF8CD
MVPRGRCGRTDPFLPHLLDRRPARPRRALHPVGFDLAAYWQAYLEQFDARRHRGEAIIRLSPQVLDRLPHLVEPAVAQAARRTAGTPDADGWTRVTIPIESADQALPELLELGADAEVLAPAELRERLTRTLDALNRIYGTA